MAPRSTLLNNGERIQSKVNGACIEPIHLFSRGLSSPGFKISFWGTTTQALSVTNNSVGPRTAAVGKVGTAIVAHVARSGRSRIDAVICNWKGLQCSKKIASMISQKRDLERLDTFHLTLKLWKEEKKSKKIPLWALLKFKLLLQS